jgi:hypothetical protein
MEEAFAFPFGESVGAPSRWNTLRALRVLRWYERVPSGLRHGMRFTTPTEHL